MNKSSILILSLIAFMLIAYYFYYTFFNTIYNQKINPLINSFDRHKIINKRVVWTYIEDPIFFDQDYHIQLLNRNKNVPIFLKLCLQILNKKINKEVNTLIVVSPANIHHYLPDFPIKMNAESKYPIKFRVDLLAACLLEKYGGLFVSPGTVVMQSVDEIMYNIKFKYDLITFGGSIRNINSCDNPYNPGNYIIAAKQGHPVISYYKESMLENINSQSFTDKLVSEDLLSYSLQRIKPNNYFHFNCEYTGNVDNQNHIISLNTYFGYEPIHFKNKDNLIFIALPYDLILYDTEFYWVNNLSEKQFVEANTNITEIISKEVYKK
tara:strand:- start:2803 stop:3771 length:969 start_codon:yes stop_codon:yes gene_type:complete